MGTVLRGSFALWPLAELTIEEPWAGRWRGEWRGVGQSDYSPGPLPPACLWERPSLCHSRLLYMTVSFQVPLAAPSLISSALGMLRSS